MKKKSRRKYKKYAARAILLISAFTAQIGLVTVFLTILSRRFPFLWVLSFLLSAVAVFIIINQDMNPDVKLSLVIPILLFPLPGGVLYLLLSRRRPCRRLSIQEERMSSALAPLAEKSRGVLQKIEEMDETAARQFRYLCRTNNFPVYENTAVEYLSPGELFFERLKEKLRSAVKTIYMEYFIIQDGSMWSEILGIMAEKAGKGVDVRLIYDGMGCLKLLPKRYDELIRSLGIRCKVYNSIRPLLSATVNMRDHRKITVIDGQVAFTGGMNLADEYINVNRKLRYWKDASIMLKGDAAQSFDIMFLSLWDSLEPDRQVSDDAFGQAAGVTLESPVLSGSVKVSPTISFATEFGTFPPAPSAGFVAPYADMPSDREPVGENVYLNLLAGAREYLHICTPYFIPDAETMAVLFLSAKNGVDVKLITPYTPDSWTIHLITRTFYRQLIENGIEVYEYTPGFLHSKTVVCDHSLGVVGSINFDFRSLFFHHECAVLMYRTSAIEQLDRDFEEILRSSRRITLEECLNGKTSVKLAGSFLRLFSPLF